jgi:hypothetical protein
MSSLGAIPLGPNANRNRDSLKDMDPTKEKRRQKEHDLSRPSDSSILCVGGVSPPSLFHEHGGVSRLCDPYRNLQTFHRPPSERKKNNSPNANRNRDSLKDMDPTKEKRRQKEHDLSLFSTSTAG